MLNRYSLITLLSLIFIASNAFGAATSPNFPSYDPIPKEWGTGGQNYVTLPPQVPPTLPNGAVNLDYVWTQNGGARLYWNTLTIPIQLKMAGATWVDPALVPQLIPDKTTPQRRYRYRRPVKRTAAKAQAPAPVAAVQSTAIPLPATPVAQPQAPVQPKAKKVYRKKTSSIPPLRAQQPPVPSQSAADDYVVTPPRLQ